MNTSSSWTLYDITGRETKKFLLESTKSEVLFELRTYGESEPEPEKWNLRGQLFQIYDQAGTETNFDYDFTSALVTHRGSLRHLLPESGQKYNLRYTYNDAGLPETIEANVRGKKRAAGDLLWETYVAGVDYNELSYATTVYFVNGHRTINEFDAVTLQLKIRRTLSHQTKGPLLKSSVPSMHTTHPATERLLRNSVVNPDVEYTYNPTYRLIESSGREQLGKGNDLQGGSSGPNALGAFQMFKAASDAPREGIANRTADDGGQSWTRAYCVSSTAPGLGLTSMPHLARMDWNALQQLQTTSRQVVRDDVGATPERTWCVYDSRGTRIRKITERQESEGATATSPRKFKEWVYLGDYELFRKYAGDRVAISSQRETFHVHGSNGRIVLVKDWTGGDHLYRPARYQISDPPRCGRCRSGQGRSLGLVRGILSLRQHTFQMQDPQRPKRFRWASKSETKRAGFITWVHDITRPGSVAG
ncbi:hypothetical protein EYZ11_012384 [Aspergillus tanneri]|uniref:Insecticide toxin TcdB middle/N-terminal domain-containing protein n=1 Tax=Aspergillus tanneri TaxID=1220188 RepID=A0A4S3J0E0_9EURO|nr:hypothetical protein EYZ11_012384 [Aspergillus tanneri]